MVDRLFGKSWARKRTQRRPITRRLAKLEGMLLEYRVVLSTPLGSAANRFAVLAGSTVTHTGPSIIGGNVGVSPGPAIVGFPPGLVTAPGTIHSADAVALQ